MSKPARSGICEFSTATSGTERERGFVGILPFRSAPLDKMFSLLFNTGERVNISFRKNFLIDIKSGMDLIKCIECV